jgi:hypothetical protein
MAAKSKRRKNYPVPNGFEPSVACAAGMAFSMHRAGAPRLFQVRAGRLFSRRFPPPTPLILAGADINIVNKYISQNFWRLAALFKSL